MRNVFSILLLIFTASCREKATTFTYTNPITGLEFRDTDILSDGGMWYAVGTCAPYDPSLADNPGVKLYSSPDLKNWKFEKLLIDAAALPDTAWYKRAFWAPELHKIGNKYCLSFNCFSGVKPQNVSNACGIAVADNIKGPYKVMNSDEPLTPFKTCDLTLFEDDDKKVYVVYNDGWTKKNYIWVAELDVATCRLKEKPVALFCNDDNDWDGPLIEGACMFKRNGIYYLLYSSYHPGYAVGYATAKNIYGPWKKYGHNPIWGCHSRNDTTWFYREGKAIPYTNCPVKFEGLGHNQVFTGPDGRFWVSYHGSFTVEGKEKAAGMIDPIWFEDGRIIANTPTYTEQRVEISPSIIRKNKNDNGIKNY